MSSECKKSMAEKVDEIHERVIRLDTLWNGGPGSWPHCQEHSEKISRIAKQNNWILRVMMLTMGGGITIIFLVEHQQLLQLLKLATHP